MTFLYVLLGLVMYAIPMMFGICVIAPYLQARKGWRDVFPVIMGSIFWPFGLPISIIYSMGVYMLYIPIERLYEKSLARFARQDVPKIDEAKSSYRNVQYLKENND